MKTRSVPSPNDTALSPLSESDQREIQRITERVQSEIGSLLRQFPVGVRTIAEISDWLSVSTPVCQRVVRFVRSSSDPLTAVTYLPGVRGLRQLIAAARDRGVSTEHVKAAEAAWRRYAELIDRYGGSQAKFLARIERGRDLTPRPANDPTPRSQTSGDPREVVFARQREATGRSFDAQIGAFLYRQVDSDTIDAATALSMRGIEQSPGAMPLSPIQIFNPYPTDADPTDDADGDAPLLDGFPVDLIPNLSSTPAPELVVRTEAGRKILLIDPDHNQRGPFDVTLGGLHYGLQHPNRLDPPVQHSTLVARGPSRSLTLDVYLDRALARRAAASTAVYFVSGRGLVGTHATDRHGAPFIDSAERRWFDRLPERPPFSTRDAAELADEAGPAAAVARHLFAATGWDLGDFVAFRMHVAYPLWGLQYLLQFDFR